MGTDVAILDIDQPVDLSGNVSLALLGGVAMSTPKVTVDSSSTFSLSANDSLTLSNAVGFDLEITGGPAGRSAGRQYRGHRDACAKAPPVALDRE